MSDLPEPRADGTCCKCNKRPSVTKDKRFCTPCLKNFVVQLNPANGCFRGMYRTGDHKQARASEQNNALDDAVRALEDAQ